MKYHISKFDGGGLLFSAVANPLSAAALESMQSSESSGSGSSKDDKLISDSILAKISEYGNPNDVRKLMSMIYSIEQDTSLGFGIDRRKVFDARAYAAKVISDGKNTQEALKYAYLNGAMDEIAVDSNGFLYVTDQSGVIRKVAPSKFNRNKEFALTYGQLLDQRRDNDALINRSDIITAIGNGVGMEKILEYVLKIINAVGSNSTTSEAYTDLISIVGQNAKQPDQLQLNAIRGLYQQIQSGELDPNTILKLTTTVKSKNIAQAYDYILKVLPQNMKNQLIGNYVAYGGNYKDASQNASNMILSALYADNKTEQEYKIQVDSQLNKVNGVSDSTSNKPKQHSLTMMEMFFNGDLNQTKITLSDSDYDNKTAMVVPGTVIPSLVTDTNESVTNKPLSFALSGKGMGKYLDYSKAFMGYLKISEGMLQNIAYSNDEVAAVWLPVTDNGDINFRLLNNFSQATKEIESKGITDVNEKNKILRQHGIYATYNSEGKLIPFENMKQFLFTHGYTIDDHVDSKNTFVKELSDRDESDIDQLIKSIYKSTSKVSGISGILNQQKWDDIIKVPIFIKIQDHAAINAATFAGYGSLVNTQNLEQSMMQQEREESTFTAGGNELYIEE